MKVNLIQQDANSWNKVMSLIEIKESNYKGSKDVNRMRSIIISRKHDWDKKLI